MDTHDNSNKKVAEEKPLGDYASLSHTEADVALSINVAEERNQLEEQERQIIGRIQAIVENEEAQIAAQDPAISAAVKRLSRNLKVSIEDAPTSPQLLRPEPPNPLLAKILSKSQRGSEASRVSALIDPAVTTDDEAAELLDELESLRAKEYAAAEWDLARSTVKTKARWCYVWAMVQLIVEASLLLPALFLLVDFVTMTLGVVAIILILFSFCMTDTALFYTILLNMLASGLEIIPLVQFIQMVVQRESSVTLPFHLFPKLKFQWPMLIIFVGIELLAIIVRLVSITLAWRYRNAVITIKQYIDARMPMTSSDNHSSSEEEDEDNDSDYAGDDSSSSDEENPKSSEPLLRKSRIGKK